MKDFDVHEYADIIAMPRHISKKHPQMAQRERAAQFAPFAALTGYKEAIEEVQRLTVEKKELSEDQKEMLDRTLELLRSRLSLPIRVRIRYFKKDKQKAGGSYEQVVDLVKSVDDLNKSIVLQNGMRIAVDDIFELQCAFLPAMRDTEASI